MTLRETRANVLVYAILLMNFWVVIAYVIFTKSQTLIENTRYAEMVAKLTKNIEESANLAIDYDISLNKNGSGFTNTVSCPILSLSGTAGSMYREDITTTPYLDGPSIVCSGSSAIHSGKSAKLTYDPSYLSFSELSYRSSSTPLTGTTTLTGQLSDTDSSYAELTLGSMSDFDANYNSDDYRSTSTGAVPYLDWYQDDDDLARKVSYGYIRKNSGWKMIYWNNPSSTRYIRKNSNNTGDLARFPDKTSDGHLWLDIDGSYSLRIIEFNPELYASVKELRAQSITGSLSTWGGIGYLQNNMTLSNSLADAKMFDLQNKNYGIFLSASGTAGEFLKYKLSFFDPHDQLLIYTVPLDDSDPYLIKYLGNDIIIDRENYYVQKEMEVSKPK